jgi:hypothetical protein
MQASLLIVVFSAGAPALKPERDASPYEVTNAACVTTSAVGGKLVEARFVVCEPGHKPPDGEPSEFRVRYVSAGGPGRRTSGGYLTLPEFRPGDRSYRVIKRTAGGEIQAVEAEATLRKLVLPDPNALIHPLSAAPNPGLGAEQFPGGAATKELADVVTRGLRARTAGERADVIRDHAGAANEAVKKYLEWLADRDRADAGRLRSGR